MAVLHVRRGYLRLAASEAEPEGGPDDDR